MADFIPSVLLSDNEVEHLVMALAKGQDTFTEDDAAKIVEWANEIRFNESMLNIVIKGLATVSVVNGEIRVKAIKQ